MRSLSVAATTSIDECQWGCITKKKERPDSRTVGILVDWAFPRRVPHYVPLAGPPPPHRFGRGGEESSTASTHVGHASLDAARKKALICSNATHGIRGLLQVDVAHLLSSSRNCTVNANPSPASAHPPHTRVIRSLSIAQKKTKTPPPTSLFPGLTSPQSDRVQFRSACLPACLPTTTLRTRLRPPVTHCLAAPQVPPAPD